MKDTTGIINSTCELCPLGYGVLIHLNKDEEIHGWKESNLNVLTDNNPPYAPELCSVTFRDIVCKVYKA